MTSSAHGRMRKRGSARRLLVMVVAGAACSAAVFHVAMTFEWRNLLPVIRGAHLGWLLIGGSASLLLFWLLRALRWWLLLRALGVAIPFVDIYLCTAVSLSLSIFTPFQSGEMIKVELLKKHGWLTRRAGYGSFLLERAMDGVVVLGLAGFSLLTVLQLLPARLPVALVLVGVAVAAAGGWLALRKLRLPGRAGTVLGALRDSTASPRTTIAAAILSVLSWLSVAVNWQIFLHSASVDIGLVHATALMSTMTLVCILTLVPGGLGVSEAGTAQFLVHFGFSQPLAQGGALILRTQSLVTILLGLAHAGIWNLLHRHRRRIGLTDTSATRHSTRQTPVRPADVTGN